MGKNGNNNIENLFIIQPHKKNNNYSCYCSGLPEAKDQSYVIKEDIYIFYNYRTVLYKLYLMLKRLIVARCVV